MSTAPADNQTPEDLQESPWVFISFVPEDLPWGDWLYFTLHGYPVPAALADHFTKYGFPLPETLSAFPDPNDPAHLDHHTEALSWARYLIVVVSPHSAHAAQVNEHLRAFKQRAGEERIIALVVEERPAASSTLSVRSDKREWLPSWLAWRLEESGSFKDAGPSEPLVIDARLGYANLDDVMTTLIAVLLDVPRVELELLEALTPNAGAIAETAVLSARGELAAAALANDEENERAEFAEGKASGIGKVHNTRRPLGTILLALALVITGVFFLKPGPSGDKSKSSTERLVTNTPDSNTSAPTEANLKAPELNSQQSVAAASALPELPPDTPPEAEVPIRDEVPVPEPETVLTHPLPAENQLPPPLKPPVSDTHGEREIALRVEKETALMRAEALMRQGELQEALLAYEIAEEVVHRFASLPKSRSSEELEVARVCRTLGALQTRFASTSEARRTYERGRKALQKLKLSKEEAKERAVLLADLEAGLRRLKNESE